MAVGSECKTVEHSHKYSKIKVHVCDFVSLSRAMLSELRLTQSDPSDQLAVCVECHGNLCLCVRLVLVNESVHNKRMSTSLHRGHRLNHLLMYVGGKRRLMSWLENSVCPLKQLLCLTELQLPTCPSLFVKKKTPDETRKSSSSLNTNISHVMTQTECWRLSACQCRQNHCYIMRGWLP